MRKWLTYCLLWMSALVCYSQPNNWKDTVTSIQATFHFKKDFLTINNQTTSVEEGDAIAVFSLKGGIYECVGYSTVPKLGSLDTFIVVNAHGKDSLHPKYGFEDRTPYKLFYWHKTLGCQFEIARNSSMDSLLRINNNITIKVLTSITTIPTVSYPSPLFPSLGSVSPIITPPFSNDRVIFSSTNKNLKIDSSGKIDLKQSLPGNNYTIKLRTLYKGCVSTSGMLIGDSLLVSVQADTIVPQIKDTLNIDSLKYSSLPPTCTKAGSLMIQQKSIIGKPPFTFRLTQISSQKPYTSSTGSFDELPSGVYKLEVTDSNGNMATFNASISLLLSEDCTINPVLTPDNRNGLQTVYISDAGTMKILDREGKTIREISVPGEWDGTDGKGSPAPMGDYYLFLNGQQYKIVTIIR